VGCAIRCRHPPVTSHEERRGEELASIALPLSKLLQYMEALHGQLESVAGPVSPEGGCLVPDESWIGPEDVR
jgi:hypothetical protein